MKTVEETNNRNLKETQPIFTITMLDYFPHMSVFHQEKTGFDVYLTQFSIFQLFPWIKVKVLISFA
jgi:hypothetical protein